MGLTSRERVLAVFDHVEPDRVPAWCGSSVEFWAKAKKQLGLDDEALRIRFGDDFRRVWARYVGPEVQLRPGAVYATPFGIQRHGMGYGQPMSHPLAEATIEQIHDYPWPKPDWMDVSAIRDEALQYDRQYAILGGDWSPFWHDAIDLFGMENLMLRMYDEPEAVHAVFQHIVDYYAAVSERIFEAAGDAIDIFFIGNDFGSQTGPLLGEGLFRQFCLPHLRRLVELGHAYGLKVMLHCCGGFAPLIPAMIEIGLDGLHAVQSSCQGMEPAVLKKTYGRQIVFNGAIDSQHILIEGTPEFVRRKTREVLDIMKPGGGYIAGASHDSILEETPVENVAAMFDAIREFGMYR
ncbi:MAG: uroporphyrinogen decarboxylase family protein [Phycisphaerae bacterium]